MWKLKKLNLNNCQMRLLNKLKRKKLDKSKINNNSKKMVNKSPKQQQRKIK